MHIANEIDSDLHETKQLSTSNIYIYIHTYIYIYIYIYMEIFIKKESFVAFQNLLKIDR